MSDYISTAEAEYSLQNILNVYNDTDGTYQQAYLIDDIEAAEGMVNAAIRARYSVPATSSQSVQLCKDLSLKLLREMAYSRLAASETPFIVTESAKAARITLGQISAGKLQLPDETQNESSGLASYISTKSNTPAMTRTKLQGW